MPPENNREQKMQSVNEALTKSAEFMKALENAKELLRVKISEYEVNNQGDRVKYLEYTLAEAEKIPVYDAVWCLFGSNQISSASKHANARRGSISEMVQLTDEFKEKYGLDPNEIQIVNNEILKSAEHGTIEEVKNAVLEKAGLIPKRPNLDK